MSDITNIISEIEGLPQFRNFSCPQCATELRVHALEIYAAWSQCGTKTKCRSFGAIGTEIQDVIDAVLIWAGDGPVFEAVMKRREEILAD